MAQTSGLKRNTIDKFYTSEPVVEECMIAFKKHIAIDKSSVIIEPSAGNGAFIADIKNMCDQHYFYDIAPDHPDVVKQDFLEYNPPFDNDETIHIVGNPPFGRQSALAIKFIKHCCTFATSISFILPRSFKKVSMQKYFHELFHCVYEADVAKGAFIVNDKPHDVPCVFQIWIKKETPRAKPETLMPINYRFVKQDESPDISFRRVGVNASDISTETQAKSKQSHYFIKFDADAELHDLIEKVKKISFDAATHTVGPKSISKQELIKEFNQALK